MVNNSRLTDVLLALSGTDDSNRLSGSEVLKILEEARRPFNASTLLSTLLQLESAGFAKIQRIPTYEFNITQEGQRRAYESGVGKPISYLILMLDLAGFTTFTSENGDKAARDLSDSFFLKGSKLAKANGGRVIKSLGDGLLVVLPPPTKAFDFLNNLRKTVTNSMGDPWPIHVGCHLGTPLEFKNDIYGQDVNLVSRLCSMARDDEVILTTSTYRSFGSESHISKNSILSETVKIRGLSEPLEITRVDLNE